MERCGSCMNAGGKLLVFLLEIDQFDGINSYFLVFYWKFFNHRRGSNATNGADEIINV